MEIFHVYFITVTLFVSSYAKNEPFETAKHELDFLKNHLHALTRQTMLQQFFNEQKVRSDGQSGLKTLRQSHAGTKNYFVNTHTGNSAASIHDHSNNIRTVGMGEFAAVLNGVEFTTRHNDYSLRMSHRTSPAYHDTEEIPFPDVPPEVLSKKTVQGQVEEMREWFKAWRDQNYSVRDYRKYFKATLCYLEGAWSTSGTSIDEPFKSDRHFVDAATWMELHAKLEFTAYTGSKSRFENLSFLPTRILGFINETIPRFAQWNYRILCHPVKRDIPLNRLRVVEDLSSRMMTNRNIYRHLHSRAARFQLNTEDSETFNDRPVRDGTLLDQIMEEIPGKDNHQGHLTDEGLDTPALNDDDTMKDVSRYHRWFKLGGKDAMGDVKVHRGYSDDYLFAAMNTQEKVAGVDFTKCANKRRKDTCYQLHQKWSYAIPLEIIFLTPLYKWNPYNLKYYGTSNKETDKIVKNNDYSRNGVCKNGKEYNGTHSKVFYQTPSEFYSGGNVGSTGADTARSSVCVLDQEGISRAVRATGTHVFLPSIKDVGVLRTRYPIFPVHAEGSSVSKELNALKDIVMNNLDYMKLGKDGIQKNNDTTQLTMGMSHSKVTTAHTHDVELTAAEVSQLKGGHDLYKTTSIANSHEHVVRIRWSDVQHYFYYNQCDHKNSKCWDQHGIVFQIDESDENATI